MRKFSRRTTKKTKVKLNPNEVRDVIEREFGDDKGNKTKLRFDFRPHPIKEPIIQLDYDYGDKK